MSDRHLPHIALALAVIGTIIAGCGGASGPVKPPVNVGVQALKAENAKAQANASMVYMAMSACQAEMDGGAGSTLTPEAAAPTMCSVDQLKQMSPESVPLLDLGAQPGGITVQPVTGGGFRVTGYSQGPGQSGAMAFWKQTSGPIGGVGAQGCSPQDPVLCPNGSWPYS